ncbi:ribonuclease H protein [Canna indica]|uniref:Ribonuclease H protein n=1 Tax=Canna indica TaxID=4628 RepID=A0AAQ3KSR6_9LILI|nr:ribonuclease H protein [Canna indica]
MLGELNISELPWMLVGDINYIVDAMEKRGGKPFKESTAVVDFKEFIGNCGLIDARFKGPLFTWSNKRKEGERIAARLDRDLYNVNWLDWNLDISVEHLNMLDSDHRPLLSHGYRRRPGKETPKEAAKKYAERSFKIWPRQSRSGEDAARTSKYIADRRRWVGIQRKQNRPGENAVRSDEYVADLVKMKQIWEESLQLEKSISMEEIWTALSSMGRGKIPGKDGFIVEFFLHNWEVIKEKIRLEINSFQEKSKLPHGWSDTILVLIPKKENAKRIGEFRPIALCNVFYKMVAKILANRIRPLLSKIISPEQSAFVPGRSIQDNIMIVAELIDSFYYSKGKKPYLMLKLDLQKAYDRVRWEAIYEVMNHIGFTRRQGDPMSLYLFILMEEILSATIRKDVSEGSIEPYKLRDFNICQLLFADYIIFTIKGSVKSCKGLKKALDQYYLITRQKVNIEKSKIFFPKYLKAEQKHKFCNFFGMKEGQLPMKYLGAYLSPKKLNEKHQNMVYQKVVNRMEIWAKNLISQAEKAVLINTVAFSIPVYNLMTTKVSGKVVKKINSSAREFFWASGKKKGANLIS